MITAEIKKGGQTYLIDIPETDLNKAYEHALAVATNHANYITEDQIIDLGTSKEYDHIRVFRETDLPAVEPAGSPPVMEKEDNYIKSFEDKITYLGQTLSLKGVKAVEDGVPFVLLYEINDQPAQVTVSGNGLQKLTQYQGEVLGYNSPMPIVPPADLLSEEDALEYVEDYLKDLRKATEYQLEEKNAVPYFGFTKDEE